MIKENEQEIWRPQDLQPAPMKKPAHRGFAAMDHDKQRSIASRGGRMAHIVGRAHKFTSEEARVAGQKGGRIVSQDREHMRAIGREGGMRRALRLVKNNEGMTKSVPTVPMSSVA